MSSKAPKFKWLKPCAPTITPEIFASALKARTEKLAEIDAEERAQAAAMCQFHNDEHGHGVDLLAAYLSNPDAIATVKRLRRRRLKPKISWSWLGCAEDAELDADEVAGVDAMSVSSEGTGTGGGTKAQHAESGHGDREMTHADEPEAAADGPPAGQHTKWNLQQQEYQRQLAERLILRQQEEERKRVRRKQKEEERRRRREKLLADLEVQRAALRQERQREVEALLAEQARVMAERTQHAAQLDTLTEELTQVQATKHTLVQELKQMTLQQRHDLSTAPFTPLGSFKNPPRTPSGALSAAASQPSSRSPVHLDTVPMPPPRATAAAPLPFARPGPASHGFPGNKNDAALPPPPPRPTTPPGFPAHLAEPHRRRLPREAEVHLGSAHRTRPAGDVGPSRTGGSTLPRTPSGETFPPPPPFARRTPSPTPSKGSMPGHRQETSTAVQSAQPLPPPPPANRRPPAHRSSEDLPPPPATAPEASGTAGPPPYLHPTYPDPFRDAAPAPPAPHRAPNIIAAAYGRRPKRGWDATDTPAAADSGPSARDAWVTAMSGAEGTPVRGSHDRSGTAAGSSPKAGALKHEANPLEVAAAAQRNPPDDGDAGRMGWADVAEQQAGFVLTSDSESGGDPDARERSSIEGNGEGEELGEIMRK